ncbi:MAG: NAD(P)H-hydrate epimerase [Phycisphaerae bacterium]
MAIPYATGEALTCQEIRELDILAIEHVGIPGIVLMENAARAVADCIYQALLDPTNSHVLFFCGPGNNGGDGFVAARHLRNAGVRVTVVLAASREQSKGDAALNLGIYERMEGALLDGSEPDRFAQVRGQLDTADVIVDALLGTGSTGAPRGVMAELIRLANAAPRARRVAIDIPSGLNADTGEVSEPCFKADATVTFVAPKVGFAASSARAVLGRVVVADIGVPRELIPGRKEISSGA